MKLMTEKKRDARKIIQSHPMGQMLCGVAGIFLITACTSNPPPIPKTEIRAAEQAISTAEQERAAENAPLEMKEAHDKLNQANNAIQNEDMKTAQRLAEESALMAQLAAARSEALKAKQANDEIEKNIDTLKEEMQRSIPGGKP